MAEGQTESNAESLARALDPSSFGARVREGAPRRSEELHVCSACGSELVYPLEWEPAGRRSWRVALRCPDCERRDAGVYSQEVVDRFDEALDAGCEQLLGDLGLLTRANLEDEVERFTAALWAGHVLPEDF